jgi:hypothetical protein
VLDRIAIGQGGLEPVEGLGQGDLRVGVAVGYRTGRPGASLVAGDRKLEGTVVSNTDVGYPPATGTGTSRIVVVPSPSWPSLFSPQQ